VDRKKLFVWVACGSDPNRSSHVAGAYTDFATGEQDIDSFWDHNVSANKQVRLQIVDYMQFSAKDCFGWCIRNKVLTRDTDINNSVFTSLMLIISDSTDSKRGGHRSSLEAGELAV
jgi:hypothetical protein